MYVYLRSNSLGDAAQGLAVIFSQRQVYVKREGRTLFLLPKVKVEFRFFLFLSILLSPYKPEMSMIRSCPDRLEFKNECYSTVNQSISKKQRYLH